MPVMDVNYHTKGEINMLSDFLCLYTRQDTVKLGVWIPEVYPVSMLSFSIIRNMIQVSSSVSIH